MSGLQPLWFHVCNVLLHAAASLLFTRVCLAVAGLQPNFAGAAGVLFAAHPIHTEAVSTAHKSIWATRQAHPARTVALSKRKFCGRIWALFLCITKLWTFGEIAGFLYGLSELFCLLGYYIGYARTFRDTYRTHLRGSVVREKAFSLGQLTHEDRADRLSRNAGA